jgi:DNA topoisomerase-1
LVDSVKEKIGGYLIEAPTLFKGRGDHPKAGFMKARIMPEDIVINIAKNAPVPKCEMKGHAWKDIVHNNEVFIYY